MHQQPNIFRTIHNDCPLLLNTTTLLRIMLACLLGLGLLACERDPSDQAEIVKLHLRQAEAYRTSGQYRASTIEARNAIQKMPGAIDGYIAMAKIYNDLGMYRQAIAQLEELPAMARSNRDYLVQAATAYNGRGKFRSALKLLEENRDNVDEYNHLLQLQEANALAGVGLLTTAEDIYSRLIANNPDDIQPLLAMARMYARNQQMEMAQELADKASDLAPDSADSHLLQAQLSITKGRLETAEIQLSEAIANLPSTDTMTLQKSAVIRLLADVLTNMGRTSEALVYTRMLADAFPGSDVAAGDYREAAQLYTERKFEEASVILTRLVADYPNYEDANVLLAIIKYHLGDNAAAVRLFENNIDPETSHEEITRLAAIASIRNQEPEKVIALLENDIENTNDITLLSVYGVAALITGRSEEGEKVINRALSQDSSQVKLYIALANFYNAQGLNQGDKALAYLQQGYDSNPGSSMLASHLAYQYVKANQVDAAKAIVDRRLELYPDAWRTYVLAGDFNAALEQREKASNFYQKAHQLQPGDLEPLMKMGTNHMLLGEHDKAISSFLLAAAQNSGSATPYIGILGASKLKGNIEQGVRLLDPYIEEIAALQALVDFFVKENDLQRAKNYGAKIAALAPDSDAAKNTELVVNFRQLRSLIDSQSYAEARKLALRSLSLEPDSLPMLAALAEIEIRAGNHLEAAKLIERVEAVSGPLANELRGDLFTEQQDTGSAIEMYRKAWQASLRSDIALKLYNSLQQIDAKRGDAFVEEWLLRNPDSPQALSIKGANLIVQGDYQQAARLLERARAAIPGSVQVLNNLAWAYAQLEDERAADVGAEAYRLAPNSAAVVDTYGWILYLQGKTEKSVAILEKAVALAPDNAEISEHLQQARAAL